MKRLFNKYDVLILLISLGAAVALSAIFFITGRNAPQGGYARISVNGSVAAELPLSEDVPEYSIIPAYSGVNILEIRGGTVRMAYAGCPGGSCVRQGSISRAGQFIVCLPNRVVVEVAGENRDPHIDAVTR
ncbi:MAG: NusG domain II-containing protein [Defluviitaleaceae bacterium]|nr:NusG domain II-containing protein [Defluviitaleaceae bacterium]MCL2835494.1 NusG domain II-containing protein [Defluviitaleaceae bacterium]